MRIMVLESSQPKTVENYMIFSIDFGELGWLLWLA